MLHTKAIISGGLLAAYLVLGSGSYVATLAKADGHREIVAFAATLPRKIYRYSVVPGGVFTPQELAAARRSDPVVAAHYADFGTNTRITRLKEDMYVYISYRKGGLVFSSKMKHKVCKGEMVITDGKNYARTRCANRLMKVFKPPAMTYNEPKPPELDIIEPPDVPYGDVPSDPNLTQNYSMYPRVEEYPAPRAQTGATPGGPTLAPEVIFPQFAPLGGIAPAAFAPLIPSTPGGPGGGGGGGTTGGGTPGGPTGGGPGTPTPEPTAFALLLAGLALLPVFGKKWRNRRVTFP